MKIKTIRTFFVLLLLGTIGVTTALGNGIIKSANHRDTTVYIKGNPIDSPDSLVMVGQEGKPEEEAFISLDTIAGQMGYSVLWQEESVHLYPKPLAGDFSLVEYNNQPLPLLAADHGEDVYLYELRSGVGGAVLTYKNISGFFEWSSMSPRLNLPQLNVYDYDNDGSKEVAVSLNNGSGTYTNIDELHVVKVVESQLVDYQYDREACREEIEAALSYELRNIEGKPCVHIELADNILTADLSSVAVDWEAETIGLAVYTGYQLFELKEDGKIHMSTHLCIYSDEGVDLRPIGKVTAEVTFANENFSLTNMAVVIDSAL